MNNPSIGTRLYISVLAVFLAFAVSFIVFQYDREKKYKIDLLETKLQDYNERMAEVLSLNRDMTEATIDSFVLTHPERDLRVTLINMQGRVIYDSKYKKYRSLENHLNRTEVKAALRNGQGYDIDRLSTTLNQQYFYAATSFPEQHFIIRSALPYNNSLARSLQADMHYIWFALAAVFILTILLYRFTRRLGANINMLRTFASRADHNENLETEDLIRFPNDELGEIAEKIIKLYQRLQRTRKEQDVLKRQLTQNIAHELKTPVASIQGYLETIIDNPKIDEAMRNQFLQRCYAQSQRLASLLRDISTLNRLDDASEMLTNFEEVDVNMLLQNIQKETALQLSAAGMTFNNLLPQGIVLRGNQSLLYSVFRNLTDNAIAYAGQNTTITLSAEQNTTDNTWHFTFSDNGVGVPHEHLARLFERFYRVDKGRSRKMGGTGLGLAIVKNAVILHGGTISATNNLDGGLRFDFTLPSHIQPKQVC